MIIDNVYITVISDTEQQINAMIRENDDSSTAYIVSHIYPTNTPNSEVQAAIQAKIDAFAIPQAEEINREDLIAELMG